MLTKLGKLLAPKVMAYPSAGAGEVGITSGIKTAIKTKNYEGTLYAVTPFYRQKGYNYITGSLSNTSYGVKFGSGNSEESEESYTLDSPIDSGLTVSVAPTSDSVYYEYDSTSNSIQVYLLYTVTNTSSADITINEIGNFAAFDTTDDIGETPIGTSTYKKCFLVDRTLLDAPLTLPPNDSAVIKYAFSLVGSEI